MFFVLRADPVACSMALSIEPDWTEACYHSMPMECQDAPPEVPEEHHRTFVEQVNKLADSQSLVVILKGAKQLQAFVDAHREAPNPWPEYAAAFSHMAEHAGLVVSAHLWMPNFYETAYGKRASAHIKETIAN